MKLEEFNKRVRAAKFIAAKLYPDEAIWLSRAAAKANVNRIVRKKGNVSVTFDEQGNLFIGFEGDELVTE